MKKSIKSFAVLAFVFFPIFAHAVGAQMVRGLELSRWAEASTKFSAGDRSPRITVEALIFFGYVMGVTDSATALEGLCIPVYETKRGELVTLVRAYLAETPGLAMANGQDIVFDALRLHYPCS